MGRQADALPWISAHEATGWEYPWETSLSDQAHLNGVMMHLKDGEGKRRSFMVNCTPIQGNEGEIRGVLASFEDVTQLEATQQELSRSKEAADAANRAKSEFLASMSHEIRTPMNAILGFTDVLRRGFEADQKERQEYLNTIHASGQHLLEVINDILDLSKVEAGRLDVERIRCGPLQMIHEAVSVLRGQAEQKGLRLCYEAPQGLPETIITDPVRFRQVLTNLVGNAIKFTENGEVRVVARMTETDGRSQLAVDVIDTGIGIPHGTLQVIFDPFVQADTSVTRRFGGTGLGLAISRRFALALGGDLQVESEFGRGSIFTFTVDTGPLEGTRMVSCDSFKDDAKDDEALGPLPAGRVLVVDDGESNRKLIHLVLERVGVTVESACNGREAVDAATASPYHVILMDMQMPVMDGLTATTLLREQGYEAPIIALTADAMKGTEEKCRAAGCTGFLTKPVAMDELIRALARALRDQGCEAPGPGDTSVLPAKAMNPQTYDPLHSTLPTDDPEFCEIIVEFAVRLREGKPDAASEHGCGLHRVGSPGPLAQRFRRNGRLPSPDRHGQRPGASRAVARISRADRRNPAGNRDDCGVHGDSGDPLDYPRIGDAVRRIGAVSGAGQTLGKKNTLRAPGCPSRGPVVPYIFLYNALQVWHVRPGSH